MISILICPACEYYFPGEYGEVMIVFSYERYETKAAAPSDPDHRPLSAACIPVMEWITEKWSSAPRILRLAIILFILLQIPVTLVFGFGQNKFCRYPFVTEDNVEAVIELAPILPEDACVPLQ